MYSSILSTNLGRYAKQQDVTTTVFFHILFTLIYIYLDMYIKKELKY